MLPTKDSPDSNVIQTITFDNNNDNIINKNMKIIISEIIIKLVILTIKNNNNIKVVMIVILTINFSLPLLIFELETSVIEIFFIF